MKTILTLLVLVSVSAFALEVDEKLTVRIVKVSESKKTMMVNRGVEDGIAENDHAKFIVTAGIVARAVCVKVSPTRSIWSVYRLVNADYILNDSVMTLKITPPVKITKDESQTLVQDDTPKKVNPDVATLGIPLAEGAQDATVTTEEADSKSDLKALEEATEVSSIVEKNLEVFGVVAVSGLSSSTKSSTGSGSINSSQSFYHLGVGGEWYARREREWYGRFSLVGDLSILRENSQGYEGSSVKNEMTEFTVGANWHPFAMPSAVSKFIPYLHLGLGMGSIKSTTTPVTSGVVGTALESNGSTNSFSIGFGYKFYTQSGFGFRALLDYYTRTEAYKEDIALNKYTKTTSGPRLLLGISYRF